ncbi:MAG TPA: tetratricopeptide repeat protein [Terriglobales bacterium]|nr:tetratricopeptide repeat protein [Terriglobales bacterium]
MRNQSHGIDGADWRVVLAMVLITTCTSSLLAEDSNSWVTKVRAQLAKNNFAAAARVVDERLHAAPDDLEAQGWRARILAWSGKWPEAEMQYRDVLRKAPNDVDILLGLSDVLFWEGKLGEAASLVEQAQELQPGNFEIAIRRSKLDTAIREQRASSFPAEANAVVIVSAGKQPTGESHGTDVPRYSASISSETDLFNYTSPIQAQGASFGVNWNPRWRLTFSGVSYRRLGQAAAELAIGVGYRISKNDSLSFSFGQGPHQQIGPLRQMSLDYDRGLKLHLGWVRGLEVTAHSASVWFDGSQVTVLGGTAIAYLPRDWMWIFTGNQARTDFFGTGTSWSPAASTRLSFPTSHRLRLDAGYGVGAENYSNIDQIGRISARTYSGAVHFRMNPSQEFSTFIAYQQRSHGQTQTSIGGGYGFHF